MTNNEFVKQGPQHRALMFEILLVFMIVGLLIFISLSFYEQPIEGSQQSVVEFHAGVFARAMANIHALGQAAGGRLLRQQNSVFHLSEHGWPANTDQNLSPATGDQTAEECRQLWNAVFFNAPASELSDIRYKQKPTYIVSLKQNVICRYELLRKQEGRHFFDYDVSRGEVHVHRP